MSRERVRQIFAAIVNRRDQDIELDLASLLMAKEEYPDLDVGTYLEHLDQMAEALRLRVQGKEDGHDVIKAVNAFLFDELGFAGNQDDYYDPRNSFLNQVLDRRTGIPIALSVLYLEIARRLNLPIRGVGLPSHFIVRYERPGAPLYIDPFHKGLFLSEDDCVQRLRGTHGPDFVFSRSFLEPVGKRQILTRMLTNLKSIYVRQGDTPRALAAVERIVLLQPHNPTEIRDRGLLRSRAGNLDEAVTDLARYLDLRPQAPDKEAVRDLLHTLARVSKRLN